MNPPILICDPEDLSVWKAVHGAQIELDAQGHIAFSDGAAWDYQLLRITDPRVRGAQLRVSFTAVPAPGCSTEVYINHWGGRDVLRIDSEGRVLDAGITTSVSVERDPATGRLDIAAEFFNTHETVSLGTTRGPTGRYVGAGAPQYSFGRIEVLRLADVPTEERIRPIDVGAAGGLHPEWRREGASIIPVCFEPNPASVALLRFDIPGFPEGRILETGLWNSDGMQTLNVTRHGGCSSILEPNPEVLGRYMIAPIFDVMQRIEVGCRRYDSLYAEGAVPVPDVVKIDVQGAEFEVLQGFGALLSQVLAVELESHIYPIYKGQKLLGDVIRFLDGYGLALRKMEPQYSFDGELVEFNLWFTRRMSDLPEQADIARKKLSFIDRIWDLRVYPEGKMMRDAMPVNA